MKIKYKKLVRDRIPEIIKEGGKTPVTHTANEEEYLTKLKEKLLEEVKEFLEEDNNEEIADILEVINSICELKNLDKRGLESIRKNKFETKGGFAKRIILDYIEDKKDI